jgi:hypothetical protein
VAKPKLTEPQPGTFGAFVIERVQALGGDFDTLMQKVNAGDESAADLVVQYARKDQDLADALVRVASTQAYAWLSYGTSDSYSRYVLEERAQSTRRDLLGEKATPLERLLVERIVVCWIQVQIAEAKYIAVMKGDTTFARARFYEDLMDRAQRRYLAAIKTLAQVRRLQLPAVGQLNVAQNQVNLATQSAGAPAPSPAELPE